MYVKKKSAVFKILITLLIVSMQLCINFSCYGVAANASAEIEDQLAQIHISANNYEYNMKNKVELYVNSRVESGFLNGANNAKLYYEKYTAENAKASIVISHGYTESLIKYHEMIYYFLENGYNVFGIEHRGHGRSGTLGIADKTQINVEDFNYYVTDLKAFMDEVVMPNSENKKVLLFAHSMGGAIGGKFLEDYPKYFNGAVLNAPMLEVNTGNIPKFLAKIIVEFQVAVGNGGKYVIGKEPYTSEYDADKISTSCLERYKYFHDIVAANEEFQRGGASYNWTNEAFKATEEITNEKNASKVEIPVLLFQAGQDTLVKPEGQNKFAKGAKNCTIEKVENSRHEIYLEKDEIQIPYLEKVLNFFDAQTKV